MKLSVNSPIAVKDLDLTQGRINTISISEKSDFQRISLLKCEIKLWLVLPNKLCAGLHKFRFEDFETFEKCSYYPVCIKYSREKKNCDIKFLQHSRPIFPKQEFVLNGLMIKGYSVSKCNFQVWLVLGEQLQGGWYPCTENSDNFCRWCLKWLISYENMEIMVLLNLMENIELLIFVSEGPPQNNYGLNSSGARKANLDLSNITYRCICK